MAAKPRFDPTREFVTLAPFLASGRMVQRGVRFDKALVSTRTLRLLYDGHKVAYDDDPKAVRLLHKSGGAGRPKPAVTVSPLTEDQRIAALVEKHDKKELLAQAKGIPGIKVTMRKDELARALVRNAA